MMILDSKFYKWSYQHRHPIFLVGLLAFFILPEIFEKVFFIKVRFPIIILILIFSSILIIHTTKKKFTLISTLLMLFLIFLTIWMFYEKEKKFELVAFTLIFSYFSIISYYLYRDIISSQEVTSSVILGAFAGYFMIGVLFFFIFLFLNEAYPDTINVDMTHPEAQEQTLYFSFITLTTIGYGDFAPTSTLGQKIAILEGLIGQFYIAAVMAIIVGKFMANRHSKK